MKNYIYKFNIEERGYKPLAFNNWSSVHKGKLDFTKEFISPLVKAANCGWRNVTYEIMVSDTFGKTEFLVLWVEEVNSSSSRWINVSGESVMSMVNSLCDNIW